MEYKKRLKDIESLINIQKEYLKNLLNQNRSGDYDSYNRAEPNPDKAGFIRVSLEINKQINKIKNEIN